MTLTTTRPGILSATGSTSVCPKVLAHTYDVARQLTLLHGHTYKLKTGYRVESEACITQILNLGMTHLMKFVNYMSCISYHHCCCCCCCCCYYCCCCCRCWCCHVLTITKGSSFQEQDIKCQNFLPLPLRVFGTVFLGKFVLCSRF